MRIENDSDGAVVDEFDVHHGGETAFGDLEGRGGAELRHEIVVETLGVGGRHGVGETRARAFAGVAIERELRDDEDGAGDVGDGAVQVFGVVGEDAEGEEFFDHPVGVRGGIVFSDANEREQARTDFADDLVVGFDRGAGDALHDGFHRAGEYDKAEGLSSLEREEACARLAA